MRVPRTTWMAALAILLCTAAAPSTTKERRMVDSNVTRSLAALGQDDDKGFAALAKQIAARSGEDIRQLLAVLHGKDEKESRKAAAVLLQLGPMAFDDLAKSVKKDDASQAVWDAQVLGDIVLDSRTQLVAVLDGLLDDTRDHPMPDHPGLEEKHPPRRVCDEAYLLERRLLNTSEPEEQGYSNGRAFLALPIAKRDAEIANAKRARVFTNFLEEK